MTQALRPLDPHHYPDDEIDLRELFATLWAGKWLIVAITILFAAGGVAYALSKPDIYKAETTLAPASGEEGGNLSRLAGQFGGLASLAGINLGGGGTNKTIIAKEVLTSRAFLTDFIHRHGLQVPLMATKGWDSGRQAWIYSEEVYNPETREWLTDEEGKSFKPTDWDLVKTFRQNHLGISEAKDTGMVTISIKSQSPEAAKAWTELLVHDINEHIRKQDVSDAERRISYLEDKLKETNIAGMQQVFYQLIENETRTVMLANAQPEYVFKTIDPAVAPQEKSEPKRALIAILATMLGGMLAVFVVFIRAFIKNSKPNKPIRPEPVERRLEKESPKN